MTTKPHAAAKPKSARRRAREFILQGLYQWRVGGADEAAIEAYAPEMEGLRRISTGRTKSCRRSKRVFCCSAVSS